MNTRTLQDNITTRPESTGAKKGQPAAGSTYVPPKNQPQPPQAPKK